jgi:hypothetical protein
MDDAEVTRHALEQAREREENIHNRQYVVALPSASAPRGSQQPRQQRKANVTKTQQRNLTGGRRQREQEDDEGDGAGVDGAVGPGKEQRGSKSSLPWGPRMERLHTSWETALPTLKGTYIQTTPLLASRLQQRHQQLEQVLQCISEAWRFHKCSSPQWDPASEVSQVQLVGERNVTYFSWHCRHHITMPEWKCSCCQAEFEPSPLHAGCWPCTPSEPQTLFDMDLMRQYQTLGLREGLSCTGKCMCHAVGQPTCCPHAAHMLRRLNSWRTIQPGWLLLCVQVFW